MNEDIVVGAFRVLLYLAPLLLFFAGGVLVGEWWIGRARRRRCNEVLRTPEGEYRCQSKRGHFGHHRSEYGKGHTVEWPTRRNRPAVKVRSPNRPAAPPLPPQPK